MVGGNARPRVARRPGPAAVVDMTTPAVRCAGTRTSETPVCRPAAGFVGLREARSTQKKETIAVQKCSTLTAATAPRFPNTFGSGDLHTSLMMCTHLEIRGSDAITAQIFR